MTAKIDPLRKRKRCSDCRLIKPIAQFPRNVTRPDGHISYCFPCNRIRRRAEHKIYFSKPEKRDMRRLRDKRYLPYTRVLNRIKYGISPERKLKLAALQRKKFPKRIQARRALSHALKAGRIIRPSRCERCRARGTFNAAGRSNLHGHHAAGYSKANWLNVIWLCTPCHEQSHLKGKP